MGDHLVMAVGLMGSKDPADPLLGIQNKVKVKVKKVDLYSALL